MNEPRILIVDDEEEILENLDRILSEHGCRCWTLSEPQRFRELSAEVQPDVVITDLRMPVVDGMTLLAVARADDADLPVIVITGHASVGSAVQAIQEGAFDYLAKPFKGKELIVVVDRAVRYRRLARENERLREAAGPSTARMVGSSPSMVRLGSQIEKVAGTDANVLVLGETGAGKELVAEALHELSGRVRGPFVPVDCAALPEGLLESELFGHEKGAFTGAITQRRGLLQEANGGTVFLDEIGEMPMALQAKLLRALEQRRIRPVGSSRPVDLDIRVVAATNVDLEKAVREGTFREDLYFRLNVVRLVVPPLRARKEDIPLLVEHFLRALAKGSGRRVPTVSPETWEALDRFDWPGNIRQLRNVVERAVAFDSDDRITISDLPSEMRAPRTTLPRQGSLGKAVSPLLQSMEIADLPYAAARDEAIEAFRQAYLDQLLEAHAGNISRAAKAAGISRRTLHRWLAGEGNGGEPEPPDAG
ncbi:MAG: sigma-54 dependent transcriptional regulator [Gemmatimonadota bacterium]